MIMNGKWHVLVALHNRTLFRFPNHIMSVRTPGTRIHLKLLRLIDYGYTSVGAKHYASPEIACDFLALAYLVFVKSEIHCILYTL